MATIPYSDVLDHETLPIDAQDVVTKVRLVIAGNLAGRAVNVINTYEIGTPAETMTYFADPLVYEYEAAEHATIGAVRSFGLPEGLDPFLLSTDAGVPEPDSLTNFTNAGSPSAVRDGDPATYATPTSIGSYASIGYTANSNIVGYRVKYLSDGDPSPALPRVILTRFGLAGVATTTYHYLDLSGEEDEFYFVLPLDARNDPVNNATTTVASASVSLECYSGQDSLRVHEFYPLILNEALLEEIARAQLRLPAASPKRVTVSGTIDPLATSHTITGWPGGDYTAQVARQTYREGVTVIDFEQAGAPLGAPQEVVEAERVRVARTRASIETAGYSLRMGERQ